MTINIYQLPPGADFNPCGCGGTSGGSGEKIPTNGSGTALPGGTSGGAAYVGQARVIDMCENVQTIFIDAIGDYINTVQTLQYVPVAAQYDEFAEQLGAVSIEDFTQLEAELTSPESISAFKTWVAKHFDDPFGGFESRWQLRRQIFGKTPLTVNGALFQPILLAWADTANIQALNKRILDVAGTASYGGECAALQRSFGRDPYQPPSFSGDLLVLEDASYKYTRVFIGQSEPDGGFNLAINGADFVGYLIRQKADGGSGTGTIYTHSQSFTHTEGTTAQSGSVGSGNRGLEQAYGSGLSNVGQVAYDSFPGTFLLWNGQTNPTNPSGAVFPAVGSFSGTVTGSNGLGSTTELDVWIVTGLDGSASLS